MSADIISHCACISAFEQSGQWAGGLRLKEPDLTVLPARACYLHKDEPRILHCIRSGNVANTASSHAANKQRGVYCCCRSNSARFRPHRRKAKCTLPQPKACERCDRWLDSVDLLCSLQLAALFANMPVPCPISVCPADARQSVENNFRHYGPLRPTAP